MKDLEHCRKSKEMEVGCHFEMKVVLSKSFKNARFIFNSSIAITSIGHLEGPMMREAPTKHWDLM